VLMHAAPLETPADVAWVLASYAREALARMERAELPALASVRSALCRPLTPDEAREGTGMWRRIAAILLLQAPLDANYQMVKECSYGAWKAEEAR
jgi:hypothetical protein